MPIDEKNAVVTKTADCAATAPIRNSDSRHRWKTSRRMSAQAAEATTVAGVFATCDRTESPCPTC
jgi:hypothetical protein